MFWHFQYIAKTIGFERRKPGAARLQAGGPGFPWISCAAAGPTAAPVKESLQLVTREEGLGLYEDMILGQMYYRSKMFVFVQQWTGGRVHGIHQGAQGDYICSTYRNHVHALSKGVPARQVMSELFGKSTSCCRGQGGSLHMFSAAVRICFHRSMHGVHVDGMDVLKVGEVAKEAIARARRVTARHYWSLNFGLSFCPEQKSKYDACDPIAPFKKYLLEERLASEAELKAIEKKIEEIVEDAVEFADVSLLPAHSQLLENVCGSQRLWNRAGWEIRGRGSGLHTAKIFKRQNNDKSFIAPLVCNAL
ncbi:hypothetical protein SELMODRAFT_426604 [Selaginella moellendorffii]|uniref:Dehydrogenase E1 component domain-containing protein n=1 Tax=Selaginella moellendorffii TaxID=88036 RepID=D8SWX1_SELML|nr:hypothetical protein SELMODRAFT_426604 [Selaginella moellendorffii]